MSDPLQNLSTAELHELRGQLLEAREGLNKIPIKWEDLFPCIGDKSKWALARDLITDMCYGVAAELRARNREGTS